MECLLIDNLRRRRIGNLKEYHRTVSPHSVCDALRSVASSVIVLSSTATSTSNLAHPLSPHVLRSAGVFLLVPFRAACPASHVRQQAAERGRAVHEASGTGCHLISRWRSIRSRLHGTTMCAITAGTVTSAPSLPSVYGLQSPQAASGECLSTTGRGDRVRRRLHQLSQITIYQLPSPTSLFNGTVPTQQPAALVVHLPSPPAPPSTSVPPPSPTTCTRWNQRTARFRCGTVHLTASVIGILHLIVGGTLPRAVRPHMTATRLIALAQTQWLAEADRDGRAVLPHGRCTRRTAGAEPNGTAARPTPIRHRCARRLSEHIVHCMQHSLTDLSAARPQAAIKIDISNAFNTCQRPRLLSAVLNTAELAPIHRIVHWAYSELDGTRAAEQRCSGRCQLHTVCKRSTARRPTQQPPVLLVPQACYRRTRSRSRVRAGRNMIVGTAYDRRCAHCGAALGDVLAQTAHHCDSHSICTTSEGAVRRCQVSLLYCP